MLLPRGEIVCFSVEFHDEEYAVADEVDHILAHRRLSTERKPIEVMRFEISPNQHFRARHRAAKVLRPVALLLADGDVRHERLPPSLSLPRGGGGNAVARAFVSPSLRSRHALSRHHELSPPASVGRSSGRKP